MAAQTTYSYSTPKGVAGGLYDLSAHEVISRMNEEPDGKIKFGMGAVKGSTPGHTAKLPLTGAAGAAFEGVVLNGFITEHDLSGDVVIKKDTTVGIIKWGNVWVLLADGVKPKYKDPVYLITDGDERGYFTNTPGDTIEIKAEFIGTSDSGIAPVRLFHESNA